MWFETECGNAYKRLNKYGESLKQCLNVERVRKLYFFIFFHFKNDKNDNKNR
jgi:hypothetical protein